MIFFGIESTSGIGICCERVAKDVKADVRDLGNETEACAKSCCILRGKASLFAKTKADTNNASMGLDPGGNPFCESCANASDEHSSVMHSKAEN